MSLATFGGGCFWCTQAVFDQLRGVEKVECGYSGGQTENPTYEQVCTGTTGHAEIVRITFDPSQITYDDLLQVFFQTHDPTTLDRQGNDVGTQYRSVIFGHDSAQLRTAQATIEQLGHDDAFSAPIVTQVVPAEEFYAAEDYHQHYMDSNPNQSYCAAVIRPKLDKFRKKYADLLKR